MRNLLREEAKRIETEKVLKESEEKFRKIFEDHAAVKLLIDPDSMKIVDANYAAADFYGWDRDQLRRMTVDEINILSHEDIIKDLETVKTLNKIQFEFRHRLKDGSVRDVEVYTSRIRIGEKDLVHSIIHDITNRKRAEAELIKSKEKAEESDRLKTAFLQNMSHEIRTPMNAIMGFSSLLVENYNNKPVLEQYCGIITQRCKDLLEIIDDILDVSKIEAGQLSVNPVPCKINELFSELTDIYHEQQRRTGKENIEFKMTNLCVPDDIVIVTDKVKLRQIFINLINNAFKFTEAGKIEGGCKRTDEHTITFFVSDTGIGIPPDKHQAIFERFVQLNQGHGKIAAGTGLGLSIVKGLAEILGGKIWLESEENKGTTFYFSLPV
ncbi:MAG TPA: ATP-binding protein [Bacteroidales bacterium]|nr:ATP-binding protein [Bacteroidales bacterium]